jgi:hypothetical protein
MLRSHLSDSECRRATGASSPSYRQQLRDLLLEIEDMSEDTDCSPVAAGLKSLLHRANDADEATAKMLLDAIHLGEDFACLYIQNFVEFPSRPYHCRRREDPCQ